MSPNGTSGLFGGPGWFPCLPATRSLGLKTNFLSVIGRRCGTRQSTIPLVAVVGPSSAKVSRGILAGKESCVIQNRSLTGP
jgi:hypothetical protein